MLPCCLSNIHDFHGPGLRYAVGDRPMPGSGARPVYYALIWRCSRCLALHVEPVDGDRDSYQKPRDGSLPASGPEADRIFETHGVKP